MDNKVIKLLIFSKVLQGTQCCKRSWARTPWWMGQRIPSSTAESPPRPVLPSSVVSKNVSTNSGDGQSRIFQSQEKNLALYLINLKFDKTGTTLIKTMKNFQVSFPSCRHAREISTRERACFALEIYKIGLDSLEDNHRHAVLKYVVERGSFPT